MTPLPGSHPILSCAETRALEAKLFAGDETKEWSAMQRAGRAIAAAVLRDFAELGAWPQAARVLVLAGKGHNGGDALIAAQAILEKFPATRVDVIFAFGERSLRPLAARAWRELSGASNGTQQVGAGGPPVRGGAGCASLPGGGYDVCFDGLFGFQFRPPAEPRIAELLAKVNALPIRLRAAVDLPSADLFRADFTYATGCVKNTIVGAANAGRVRYVDLDFFRGDELANSRVFTPDVLSGLRGLRAAHTDKRTFGHVMIIGGSRSFPGAVLMTVLAALRSGAGLVTAFVPESIASAFAARAPEAMWVGWPETPTGGLALEGEHLLRDRIERATALVLGPGIGRERETLALAESIAKSSPVPLVIDADALQPEIVQAGAAERIVTPHAGEFARVKEAIADDPKVTTVLKGPVTRIESRAGLRPALAAASQGGSDSHPTYHSFFGGPVLARGGSGDLLAGLIGGLLAQTPEEPLLAAARGVVWHGIAADYLARAHGQTGVAITQLLDFLPVALRECADEPFANRAAGVSRP